MLRRETRCGLQATEISGMCGAPGGKRSGQPVCTRVSLSIWAAPHSEGALIMSSPQRARAGRRVVSGFSRACVSCIVRVEPAGSAMAMAGWERRASGGGGGVRADEEGGGLPADAEHRTGWCRADGTNGRGARRGGAE
ncbi:hypothetical protein AcW1_009495 [Taiwanofungus camphoratus]|nr:hypothetical protein AcW1_009495 [Antrodia cinnamomea]